MSFLVATNVIASQPARPTGTPTARANILIQYGSNELHFQILVVKLVQMVLMIVKGTK